MKKMVLTLVLAAAAVLVGALLLAPTSYTITEQTVVAASPEATYDQLRLFNRYPQWSVWKEQDPEQHHSLSGRDGEIGARYAWEGVRVKGRGFQELVSLVPVSAVTIQVHIAEPFKSEPRFAYKLRPASNGQTEVEQTFTVALGRPFNVIALLMGLKGKMRQSNQRSLELLGQSIKAVAAQPTSNHTVVLQ